MSSSQLTIEPDGGASPTPLSGGWLCVLVVGVAILLWGGVVQRVNFDRTWGWDESMDAQLPAVRIVEHVQRGEWHDAFDVVLDCDRYPFVVPLYLAAAQLAFGVSESTARHAVTGLWCAGILAMCVLVARLLRDWRAVGAAVFLTALIVSHAPIGRLYAPTLFLEAPFAAVMAFTLLAWIQRDERGGSRWIDVLAGVLFAAAFFTKFNYAVLLALGLALDAVAQLVLGARDGSVRARVWGLVRVAAMPAVACVWWFVLPLPGDFELGTDHREAFASFLAGNQEFVRVAWTMRLIDWTTLVFPSFFALAGFGLVFVSLRDAGHSGIRGLWLVALAFVAPISAHPFHLDRFLLPTAVPVWVLSISGLLRLDDSTRAPKPKPFLLAAVAMLASVAFGEWWTANAIDTLGIASPNPKVREYQQEQLDARDHVSSREPLPTGGLLRKEADDFLDLVAKAAGPTARVGWIGLSSELSPAAIHLGLLARGGSVERFLRDAHESMDVTFESADPNWTKEQLAEFAARFDVIFATDPPDMAKRVGRAFEAKYRKMLVEELGWREEELGTVTIEKALQSPTPFHLFACRPPKQ